ncbi:hypothetical protein ACFFRR_002781 [Megaselia abdita]
MPVSKDNNVLTSKNKIFSRYNTIHIEHNLDRFTTLHDHLSSLQEDHPNNRGSHRLPQQTPEDLLENRVLSIRDYRFSCHDNNYDPTVLAHLPHSNAFLLHSRSHLHPQNIVHLRGWGTQLHSNHGGTGRGQLENVASVLLLSVSANIPANQK